METHRPGLLAMAAADVLSSETGIARKGANMHDVELMYVVRPLAGPF